MADFGISISVGDWLWAIPGEEMAMLLYRGGDSC